MEHSNKRVVALSLLFLILSGGAGILHLLRVHFRVESRAEVGRPLPPIELTDLDGQPVGIEAYGGKVLLLTFVKVDCGHCQEQMRVLEMLSDTVDDLSVVLVSTDRREDAATFFRTGSCPFPVWIVSNRHLRNRLGAYGVPASFLLDEQGIVRGRAIGALPLEDIRGMVRSLAGAEALPDKGSGDFAASNRR